MKKEDHLLTVLAEECSEVAQQACKALRFGMDDFDPRDPERVSNKRRIEREVAEVIAVANMLGLNIRESDKAEKMVRLEKYMKISKRVGRLE
ncbi:MAG: hypothetical protein GTN93_21425 [Anaerolineae bacterium]|nr:hypothetical protein [Anaerolineae bacterium]